MASFIVTAKETEKFFSSTRRDETTGCLLWAGATSRGGYGAVRIGGKTMRAPRVAWAIANGGIPADSFVLHCCDTPGCVEISHLRLGDAAENSRDMVSRGRSLTGAKHWSRYRNDRVPRGERAGGAKLTAEDVGMMRVLRRAGATIATLAIAFRVSPAQAGRIVRRERWAHLL